MNENNKFRSTYRILDDVAFIIEYHRGLLTLESMIQFRKKQVQDAKFSPDYNILMDMRDVMITGKPVEVAEYVSFYQQNKNITGNRHIAVLTDTPNQVFYITLFEKYSNKLSQKTKIFSTIEASIKWLNVNISEDQVDLIIHKLRESLSQP